MINRRSRKKSAQSSVFERPRFKLESLGKRLRQRQIATNDRVVQEQSVRFGPRIQEEPVKPMCHDEHFAGQLENYC